jgi:hypothetical protein
MDAMVAKGAMETVGVDLDHFDYFIASIAFIAPVVRPSARFASRPI